MGSRRTLGKPTGPQAPHPFLTKIQSAWLTSRVSLRVKGQHHFLAVWVDAFLCVEARITVHGLLTALTLGTKCDYFHSPHCSPSGWPLSPPVSIPESRALLAYSGHPSCDSDGERQEEEGRERKQMKEEEERGTDRGKKQGEGYLLFCPQRPPPSKFGDCQILFFFQLLSSTSSFLYFRSSRVPWYRRPICSNVNNCVDSFRKHVYFNWIS